MVDDLVEGASKFAEPSWCDCVGAIKNIRMILSDSPKMGLDAPIQHPELFGVSFGWKIFGMRVR